MHIRDKNSKIEKKYRQIEKERQKLDWRQKQNSDLNNFLGAFPFKASTKDSQPQQ
jgi:hypothetical protein